MFVLDKVVLISTLLANNRIIDNHTTYYTNIKHSHGVFDYQLILLANRPENSCADV